MSAWRPRAPLAYRDEMDYSLGNRVKR
jgi:hypothetical protein